MRVIHGCTVVSLRDILRRFVVELAVATTLVAVSVTVGWNGSAVAATVTLSPGDSIQNAVNTNPAGTTFVLQPGVYRNNGVTLSTSNNGDSFIGQAGAIMDGAIVLTGWTQVSINGVLYWTTAGGTPLATPACSNAFSCCMPNYPGCNYVQDLYLDDVEYQHVTSLAGVVAGTSWYYDFDGGDGGIQNNVYLAAADNPNSHTVELGDTKYAFKGTASNITIQNLVIEKYAPSILSGAIQVLGPNWLIQNNEVRLNHGIGISDKQGGDNVQVLGNNVHHNGDSGIGGPGNGGLWDSNTVAYNNADGVNPDYAGGGSKFTGNNVMISNNIAHDNLGTGLFVDAGGSYDTFDHNTSYNNYGDGIRYETSRYGTITNNIVYGNNDPSLAQIAYTGSDHGRISGNTVIDEGHGAIVVVNIVGSRPHGVTPIYTVTDTQVTSNTIWMSTNATDLAVGLIDNAQPHQPGIFSDPTNFFDHNIYEFSAQTRPSWHWGETADFLQSISWSAWRGDGQDPNGTTMQNIPRPGLGQ
ncbi:MAG: right-handed parallel beta-helix repeat-containing protein [Deltaproteobacteria bacterium]|nr:right-handed parallel beta-helix repeat-containing protein [Deltaproteobacteria bacterium]